MSISRASMKRWGITFAAVVCTAVLVRFVAAPSPQQIPIPVPYRVELVHNDPYKVAAALNDMAKDGWYFVSAISRNDAKVLLVFRSSQ